jgi:hypothetical protein
MLPAAHWQCQAMMVVWFATLHHCSGLNVRSGHAGRCDSARVVMVEETLTGLSHHVILFPVNDNSHPTLVPQSCSFLCSSACFIQVCPPARFDNGSAFSINLSSDHQHGDDQYAACDFHNLG